MNNIPTGSLLQDNKYKCKNFKLKTNSFIETGSYLGDGIQLAINSGFSKIFSIELHPDYYNHCVNRFLNNKNIELFLGDSTTVLPQILNQYTNLNFTFWLDGHYSGPHTAHGSKECPLIEELTSILSRNINNEIIYIDDMRIYKNYNSFINETTILNLVHQFKSNALITYQESEFDKEDILIIEY